MDFDFFYHLYTDVIGYPQADIDSECKRLMDTFHMTAYIHRDGTFLFTANHCYSGHILGRNEAKTVRCFSLYERC